MVEVKLKVPECLFESVKEFSESFNGSLHDNFVWLVEKGLDNVTLEDLEDKPISNNMDLKKIEKQLELVNSVIEENKHMLQSMKKEKKILEDKIKNFQKSKTRRSKKNEK